MNVGWRSPVASAAAPGDSVSAEAGNVARAGRRDLCESRDPPAADFGWWSPGRRRDAGRLRPVFARAGSRRQASVQGGVFARGIGRRLGFLRTLSILASEP